MQPNTETPIHVVPIITSRQSSIGRILLDMKKITLEDAERILRCQKEKNLRFGEAALSLGLVTNADVNEVLSRQFDYPYLQPGHGEIATGLVAAYQPFSRQVEALRAVRSQLMLRWFTNNQKSLAVTCINRKEGVSLFAANLAIVFSQLGERTLLVDSNLREPRQHQLFKLSGKLGLSDILADRAGLEVIFKVEPFLNLSVLPAGTSPPNPQELLGGSSFANLARTLAEQFDIIIYDTSAFSQGADSLAVAARAGGALILARKDLTRIVDIENAAGQLSGAGVEIAGSVLTEF